MRALGYLMMAIPTWFVCLLVYTGGDIYRAAMLSLLSWFFVLLAAMFIIGAALVLGGKS